MHKKGYLLAFFYLVDVPFHHFLLLFLVRVVPLVQNESIDPEVGKYLNR